MERTVGPQVHLCCHVDGLAYIIHGLRAKRCLLILILRKTAGILSAESPEGVVISGSLVEIKGDSWLKNIKVSKSASHVVPFSDET